ncbi:restriction endonuclease, partial [Bacillus pseudomycoides]
MSNLPVGQLIPVVPVSSMIKAFLYVFFFFFFFCSFLFF